MDASVVVHAARGAAVWGAADVEFLLVFLALLLALLTIIGRFIYGIFLGVTRSTAGRALMERTRALEDLGPLRRTFTNYTPWRIRFGVSLVVVGAACGVIGYVGEYGGVMVFAVLALLFGIPTVLYAALLRVDRLDLHERGLVFRQGKAKPTVAYYSEIKDIRFTYVEYGSGRVPKALVIELHDGGAIQIGNTFIQLGGAFVELSAVWNHSDASAEDPARVPANAAGGAEEKGECEARVGLASEPRWRVVGTEEASGKEVVRDILAPSAEEATAVAVLDGINVTNIERIR